jgi:hypothetical protein
VKGRHEPPLHHTTNTRPEETTMNLHRTAIRTALGAAVVTALLSLATIALAAPAPATPTITTSPPNPSASTSAVLSFTGESGSTFECRLDAGPYAACSSPKPYTGLSAASHTFRVRALKGGKTSGDAVYTWTVAAPATPVIGSKPANPTNSTSATFTFTTNASNATFECALDPPFAFGTCGSPKSYPSGLSAGSHEFRVRALGAAGSSTGTSAAASYTWTIDTNAPPAPAITSGPASPTNTTSASFSFTNAEVGVSFLCRVDAALFTPCATPTSYAGFAEGAHTFQVKARDAAGNESGPTSWPWTVDTTPPSAPVITSRPDDPAASAISTFEFTDPESPVTFQCSIENGPFQACTSPFTFTVIVDTSNNGQHQFAVRAVDAAGNVSGAASYRWKVEPDIGFTITGDVGGLAPGLWLRIPVHITNPHNFTIFVNSLSVSVSSTPGTCTAANFAVQASTASAGSPIVIPANSVSFLVPLAQRPLIQLKNLGSNQDTCKGMSVSLSYSGAATK